ncbi:hypothetical protein [Microbispora sp. GKU 823]|uniref:hypothetical protein n=1 Tax=Microbispora sp. GKU 823 TaxID=1652100 RepID=UPI001C4E0DC1|nr:hypothetical protein [Microbispora sp. GKU 823]
MAADRHQRRRDPGGHARHLALKGQYSSQYHLILAAAALALLPLIVIFLLFQRHIVRSIALTGLK